MRAQLARHARRVLIQRSRVPFCASPATPLRCRQLPVPVAPRTFQRTFLGGLLQKAPREVKQPEHEPGWLKIMVWRSRMLDNLRPPPTKELIQAWRTLFETKTHTRVPLNSTQAMQCRRLLEYLLEPGRMEPGTQLDYKDIMLAAKVLRTLQPREKTQKHLDFANALYSAANSGNLQGELLNPHQKWVNHIKALCLYGGSKDALKMVYDDWDAALKNNSEDTELLIVVANGLAREGHEEELVKLVEAAEQSGRAYDGYIQLTIARFFAERDRVPETKYWFAKETTQNTRLPELYRVIASFAARNGLQDWAVPFFLELGKTNPNRPYWHSLLQAILLVGQGLKEVEGIMSHMLNGTKPIKPNTGTINDLLRVPIELKDPMLAEEILGLAAERGIKLDGESYMNLMDLRLGAGYLPGVHAALKKVQNLEPWQVRPRLWPAYVDLFNRYLSALCAQKQPEFKRVTELIESAEEGAISLYPETVATLCIRLLENEQHFDVMDTLSIHAFQFSATEREMVQDAFVEFCLNPETSTSRAWGSYQILRQFFQDLSFDYRVRLMEAFFDRKRPDMASHVFGHMRQHRTQLYHPKLETYIQCFEGFGRCPDAESVEMVHNMLKMDTTVQPNTQLYTALIIAHASCGKSLQALDFWNQITASREGPSYASLEAIFWALERKAGGSSQAREVWRRIVRMDVDIPPAVYNAYIGAIAGSGEEKEVQEIIMRMKSMVGVEPDAMTLGIAYNAFPGQKWQSNFQTWAKMRYPEAWAELEKKGRRMTEDSLCKFKLKRVFKA